MLPADPDTTDTLNGLLILLKTCLGVLPNDELLVVFDESMNPFLPQLTRAVEIAAVPTSFALIPKSYQRVLLNNAVTGPAARVELPSCVVAAISACTAMINCLDADATNAPVRKAINHTPRPKSCRLATIPGISADILDTLVRSPIAEILADSERVAWAMGEARAIEIISYDLEGRSHSLSLGLRGWETEPIMSPGVLLPGSWGNVPPGETFCCPPPQTVNGAICINGSVPGHAIAPGEEVTLEFQYGVLRSWRSRSNSPALQFFDHARRRALAAGDANWSTLAEFGIGLNPVIATLTGNPLFDEKASHTAHIAIGDNSNFGDDVVALVHYDLVTTNPTVRFDGQVLIDRGELRRELIERRRSRLEFSDAEIPEDSTIHLRESSVHVDASGVRRRLSKAHRINYVKMADAPTSQLLTSLCSELRAYNGVHLATFLKNHPTFAGVSTKSLLSVLYHYRTIRITPLRAAGSRSDFDAGTQ